MVVCVPSTPAQMYHMIRRQILRSLRKPLIVMTPKSLLRHELSVSTMEDLANGEFANVIDDVDKLNAASVRRVVLSSGKVYFDLLKARRAALRTERTAMTSRWCASSSSIPSRCRRWKRVLAKYPNAREVVWCQEEPQNQGAWYQIRHRLQTLVGKRELLYAGRPPAAAPATGISKIHEAEQRGLIEAALGATNKGRRSARHQAPHGDRGARRRGRHVSLTRHRKIHGHRNQGSPTTRVGRGCHAGHLAQAGGPGGHARREPRRPRDRQGGARSAGAGEWRAQGTAASRPEPR